MNGLVYVVCEGQSEASFVKHVLSPYVSENTGYKLFLHPYTVITSRNRGAGRVYRGGLSDYEKPKRDIMRCLKNGYPVTTMFDFFRLPNDFPRYGEAMKSVESIEKVMVLERGLKEDINSRCFLPYIQLHEFETLFFSDLDSLKNQYIDAVDEIENLKSEVAGKKPEEINNGEKTSPSKRLMNHFNYKKGSEVMMTLQYIGIDRMREKCPHFSEWVEQLIQLNG